jgi:hypothetical protein
MLTSPALWPDHCKRAITLKGGGRDDDPAAISPAALLSFSLPASPFRCSGFADRQLTALNLLLDAVALRLAFVAFTSLVDRPLIGHATHADERGDITRQLQADARTIALQRPSR